MGEPMNGLSFAVWSKVIGDDGNLTVPRYLYRNIHLLRAILGRAIRRLRTENKCPDRRFTEEEKE